MRNRSEPPADPEDAQGFNDRGNRYSRNAVSYTHLRAHET